PDDELVVPPRRPGRPGRDRSESAPESVWRVVHTARVHLKKKNAREPRALRKETTLSAPDNGKPAKADAAAKAATGAAVIRRLGGSEESTHERLLKKHLPAWVASGAVHLVIALALFFIFGGRQAE